MLNPAPPMMGLTEISVGYTKAYIGHTIPSDYDVVGRLFWTTTEATGTVIKSVVPSVDTAFYVIEGLAPSSLYRVKGGFYDQLVNDAPLLSEGFGVVFSPDTALTTATPVSISNITVRSDTVSVGLAPAILDFYLAGYGSNVRIEFRQVGQPTWELFYQGPFRPTLSLNAPPVQGIFEFRVRSEVVFNNGIIDTAPSYSNIYTNVEVTFSISPPAAPTGLTSSSNRVISVTERIDTKLQWTWSQGSGGSAEGFDVEWRIGAGSWEDSSVKRVRTGNTSSYTFTGVPVSIPIYYRVRAAGFSGLVFSDWTSDLVVNITDPSTLPEVSADRALTITYEGIRAVDPADDLPTFQLDAQTGAVVIGKNAEFFFDPIQNTLKINGLTITNEIAAAKFTMAWLGPTDSPAISTSNKSGYGIGGTGLWTGYTAAGVFAFDLGSSSQYIRFNGSVLEISAKVKIVDPDTSQSIELGDSGSYYKSIYRAGVVGTPPATPVGTTPAGWSNTIPSRVAGQVIYISNHWFYASGGLNTDLSPTGWTTPAVFTGDRGDPGTAAKIITLATSSPIFRVNHLGNIVETSVTLTSTLQNVTGPVTWTALNEIGNAITLTSVSDSGATLTRENFGGSQYVIVTASASGVSDKITINRVEYGTDAVTGLLTNESHTVSADPTGLVADFSSAGGQFLVYRGGANVTSSCTFSVISASAGLTINIISNGNYSVTGLSVDNGVATLRASYTNRGVTTLIDKVYTISKSKQGLQGNPGSAAKALSISSTAQVFTFNGAGSAAPPSQTITFTATTQNISETINWGAGTKNGTGNTFSLTVTEFTSLVGSNKSLPVVASVSSGGTTYTDTISVAKLQDGLIGSNGIDAVTGLITNESHTIPADQSGNVTGGNLALAGGSFKVYQGTVDISNTYSYSVLTSTAGITAAINSSGVYSVSALAADNATVTFRASRSGYPTIDKVYTISKSKQGTPGIPGVDAKVLTVSSNAQAFTFNGSGGLNPASQTITFLANRQNITETVNWAAGTKTGTGSSFSLTGSEFISLAGGGTSLAVVASVSSGGTTYTDTVTVIRLQDGVNGSPGLPGTPAITGLLTNESHTLAASSSGVVGSYAGCGGTFLMYSGTTQLTTGVTYSIAEFSTGLSITINSSTGAYSVSNLTVNQATARLRATYGSTIVDKIFTVSKSLGGTPGAPGEPGAPGAPGATGNPGPGFFTGAYSDYNNWATATANSRFQSRAGRAPVNFDVFTQFSPTNTALAETRMYNGSSWVTPSVAVHGNMLVNGSVRAQALIADNAMINNLGVKWIVDSAAYSPGAQTKPTNYKMLIDLENGLIHIK